MKEVVFITAVGSVSILTQGKTPVMTDDTAQNMLAADIGASFTVALDEASGLNTQNSSPAFPNVAACEENQEEKKPSAALSLVAAMIAFSPQPIIQGAVQAEIIQNAVTAHSGIQQIGFLQENAQGEAAGIAQSIAGTKAGDLENADALPKIKAEDQNAIPNDEQAAIYQDPAKVRTGKSEVRTELNKNEAFHKDEFFVKSLDGQNASVNSKGAEGFANAVMDAQTPRNVQGRRVKGADESPFDVPITAAAIAQRAEHMQQTQEAQAAQDIAPDSTAREEHAALQVARATVSAIKRGAAEYKLRLRPEGLGQVEVTVSTKGNEISLSMKTDNEDARGLILGHADELRAELRSQNFQVNGLTVEVSMDNQGGGEFTSSRQSQETFDQGRVAMEQSQINQAEFQASSSGAQKPVPRSSTISYRV